MVCESVQAVWTHGFFPLSLACVKVELFARVHHRNLVSLVGHCQEGGEQILIYEYMPNGDLRKYLHGECTVSLWC